MIPTTNRSLRFIALAILLLVVACLPARASLSGTQTVGPTGNYASLGSAFADINAQGLSGPLVLELQAAYLSSVETFPLTAGAFPGSSSTNTVTIRPESGDTALSITSNSATGTFDLNGATYVILDGRPGGTGTPKQLTIENTNTSGWALRFINDARFNVAQYLTVKGVTTSGSSGVVLFSTTTGPNGNDANTIDNCDLRDGATTPTILIYSSGTTTTTAQNNSGDIVSHCDIFNFFNATTTHVGISLASGNQDWTIQGNSFYETTGRNMTGTGTIEWQAVASSSGSTNNLQILGNYIGGSAPHCGGGPLTYTGNATLRALRLTVGATTATGVQGNTFQNISVTSTSASSSQTMIGLVTGSFGIGNVTPNVIGSQSSTGDITFALSNASTAAFSAISAGTGTPGTIVIANNLIGGITIAQVGGAGAATARGITLATSSGSGIYSVTGNTIGSPSVANSFSAAGGSMAGIVGASSGSNALTASITGNTIANLTYLGTAASNSQLFGIVVGGTGLCAVNNNTVYNLTSASTATGAGSSASVIGIAMNTNVTAGQRVTQNQVYSLSNTATTAPTCVTGIHVAGPPSGTNTVGGNLIHSLTLLTTGLNNSPGVSQITGINVNGGTVLYLNNMVRLGFDAAGVPITIGYPITGINEGVGTNTFLGNSVYVGGSGVVSSENTFALQSGVSDNPRSYEDNILMNARSNASGTAKNYAVRYGTVDGALASDYNDLYVSGTGGVLGATGAGAQIVDYPTLADWQAGTSRDANSRSADPLFVNPIGGAGTGDLHIDTTVFPPSPVANAGIARAPLAEDYDGQARSNPPDIGADEFVNYLIVANAGPNGTINPTGNVLVNAGTDLTFTMAPDSCYAVSDVLVDGGSVGPVPSYTFSSIHGDHTISASFAIRTFTISATAGPGGEVYPVAAPYRHTIHIDGTNDFLAGEAFTTTTSGYTAYVTWDDTYLYMGYTGPDINGGGSTKWLLIYLDTDPGSGQGAHQGVPYDTQQPLFGAEAVAAEYHFAWRTDNTAQIFMQYYGGQWSDDPHEVMLIPNGNYVEFAIRLSDIGAPSRIGIDACLINEASGFEWTYAGLPASSFTDGYDPDFGHCFTGDFNSSLPPNQQRTDVIVPCGADREFAIVADPGYHSVDVLVDGVSQGPVSTYTFTNVHADHTITASFAPEYLTITATAGLGGTITPSGEVPVAYGGSQEFDIAASPGHHILDVTVDGSSQGPIATYTFTDVTVDHTIDASFSPDLFTLTTGVIGDGSLTIDPDQPTYPYGTPVQITAHAHAGWQFDHWAGDAGGNDNPLTVIMDRDKTITGIFIDIAPPEVTVISPNGGEVWIANTNQTITWTATDNVGVTAIDLAYSTDGGATYPFVIGTGLPNTGSLPWVVPDTPSTTCRVRVSAHDAAGNAASDASDANFEIRSEQSAVAETLLGDHDVVGVYPNPASPGAAHVLYRIARASTVEVGIYNVDGRLVRQLGSGTMQAGLHGLAWDGRDGAGVSVPGGIYLVRFATGTDLHVTKRFVLLR